MQNSFVNPSTNLQTGPKDSTLRTPYFKFVSDKWVPVFTGISSVLWKKIYKRNFRLHVYSDTKYLDDYRKRRHL